MRAAAADRVLGARRGAPLGFAAAGRGDGRDLRGSFDSRADPCRPQARSFARSFAGWDASSARALYTGFVAEHDWCSGHRDRAPRTGSGEVVVSAGGGAVGAPLLQAALRRGRRHRWPIGRWRLLVGANMPAAERAALGTAARQAKASSSSRRGRDFTTLLANATLSISQAGYNTAIETLCCADRAVLVPFGTARETEQADRAALLAERGMVAVVPPGTLSPESLADAVGRALAGPSLRSFPPCDANGGPATASLLTGPAMSSWQALDEEAARWREAGRTAELWWRDDDAADAGPALDRLLDAPSRTTRCRCRLRSCRRTPHRRWPIVSPPSRASTCCSTATPISTMPRRVKRRPSSARTGRPWSCWASWAPAGWRWNGCSAAGRSASWCRPGTASRPAWCRPCRRSASRPVDLRRRARRVHPVRGLLQVNTHADLIDWKGGRGFAGEAAVLGALVAALAHARTVSDEPVGLLSHHLAMDGGAWDFLRSMWEKAPTMPGIRIRPAHELFAAKFVLGGRVAVEFCRSALSATDAVGRLRSRHGGRAAVRRAAARARGQSLAGG